mmetsp:Transcript_8485/g.35446  ORF Transcript_8485/g.35446 Transcript_8485/m.35446 type:complete len:213 (+) Transcript_8485:422-1060(+)
MPSPRASAWRSWTRSRTRTRPATRPRWRSGGDEWPRRERTRRFAYRVWTPTRRRGSARASRSCECLRCVLSTNAATGVLREYYALERITPRCVCVHAVSSDPPILSSGVLYIPISASFSAMARSASVRRSVATLTLATTETPARLAKRLARWSDARSAFFEASPDSPLVKAATEGGPPTRVVRPAEPFPPGNAMLISPCLNDASAPSAPTHT